MKIVFLSNYINHHQVGLCDELYKLCGNNNFYFIQEEPLTNERIKLGYDNDFINRKYVKCLNVDNFEEINKLVLESDFIINSASQGLTLLKDAMKMKKNIFWYDERLFKDYSFIKSFAKYFRAIYYYFFYKNPNQYHLLASAYGYKDIKKISKRHLKNSFEFGYFPITNSKDVTKKSNIGLNTITFLFAGRLIEWKHPEIVFEVSKYLEKRNIKYHIDIVGSGNMENKLKNQIKEKGLLDKISIIGSVPFSQMVDLYRKHDFFLFASDRREGWGAVLNEAMSYGSVPIANIEAGATLTLIKDNQNGFIYNKKIDDALDKAIESKEKGTYNDIALYASKTIVENWNYTLAVKKLYQLFSYIYTGSSVKSLTNLELLNYEVQEELKDETNT